MSLSKYFIVNWQVEVNLKVFLKKLSILKFHRKLQQQYREALGALPPVSHSGNILHNVGATSKPQNGRWYNLQL